MKFVSLFILATTLFVSCGKNAVYKPVVANPPTNNGIEYIIFGGLSVLMLSSSSYSYYNLPQYWNLFAIIPFIFAIGPTIMFIGLTGLLDHEGLSQR